MSNLIDAKKEFLFSLCQKDEAYSHSGFDNIENKLSKCKLVHALLVFERVLKDDMPESVINGGEDGIVFLLDAEMEDIFFERATNQDLEEIFHCGVNYHEDYESMFVFA